MHIIEDSKMEKGDLERGDFATDDITTAKNQEKSSGENSAIDIESGSQDDTTKSTAINDESTEASTKPSSPQRSTVLLTDWDAGHIGWDSVDDPAYPQNFPSSKKWRNVAFIAMGSFIQPFASTLFAPGEVYLADEFGITNQSLLSFMISVYLLGFGWGPLLYGPLSELFGRKATVCGSLLLLCMMGIGCSEATNGSMFIAFRFLSAYLGSAGSNVGGGTLADLFERDKVGMASSLFAIGPLIGPIAGPILGGFVAQSIGWRWSYRILVILAAVLCVAYALFVDETNQAVLLRRKTTSLKKKSGRTDLISILALKRRHVPFRKVLWHNMSRPFRMLATVPIVQCLALYMSVVFSYLYIFFTTISPVFEKRYGFGTGVTGLAYIGLGTGLVIGVATIARSNDNLVRHLTKTRGHGERKPEYRLPPMILCSILIPVSLFWFGWSVQQRDHWIVPIIGMSLTGLGMIASLIPFQTYIIDVFGPHGTSASATAAVNVARTTVGSVIPLLGPDIWARLGYGWGCTTLAFIAWAICIPMTFAMLKYGTKIRKLSNL
ncbi:major facilitator superfamily domain-containing protein [Limtongia smithiae]|uniref:major facilitator superfamily domain-containing protein n=1 Tax=Limtongia smithiae TaxID=1125753 RepID=UPI0034CFAEB7